MVGPYALRYDNNGYIDGITCHGYTVLQLTAGAERNQDMAIDIVADLNANDAIESGTKLSDWCKIKMESIKNVNSINKRGLR